MAKTAVSTGWSPTMMEETAAPAPSEIAVKTPPR